MQEITFERLLDIIEAGYGCLEFHCAHNYLPHSMLSSEINHRGD